MAQSRHFRGADCVRVSDPLLDTTALQAAIYSPQIRSILMET